jgi:hypothetical protein
MEVLGKEYVVWDKGATIKFVRPIVSSPFSVLIKSRIFNLF